jgi:hypothetical protein
MIRPLWIPVLTLIRVPVLILIRVPVPISAPTLVRAGGHKKAG